MTGPQLQDLPDLSRDSLVDLAGWAVYKEARGLVEAGAVKQFNWNPPDLTGAVQLGQVRFVPRLRLKSLTFVENRCTCPTGRQGYVCAHAIALCIRAEKARRENEAALLREKESSDTPQAEPEPLEVKSLQISESRGRPLQFRFHLPPNLARIARKDSIITRIEAILPNEKRAPEKIDRGLAYQLPPGHYTAAAHLENWCGGRLHGLLQLSRAQLREILKALHGEPVFFWANRPDRPILWQDGKLPGVHAYLHEERSIAHAKRLASPSPHSPALARHRPLPDSRARRNSQSEEESEREKLLVDGSSHFLAIRLPSRSDPHYEKIVELLKANDFSLEPSNRRWWLRDRHKTLNFLASHLNTLRQSYGARFTRNFEERTVALQEAKITCDISESGADYEVNLALDAAGVNQAELHRNLSTGRNYVLSGDKIVLIPPKTVETLQTAQRALSGDPRQPLLPSLRKRIHAADTTLTDSVLETFAIPATPPATWKSRSVALRDMTHLPAPPLSPDLDERLRSYQRIGVAWAHHLYRNSLAGILADEMGLGKTIQALGLIDCLFAHPPRPQFPVLVVCPATLVENWRREANRFVPARKVFVHHRDTRLTDEEEFRSWDMVITSYSTLLRDAALMRGIEFSLIIADEAQHIKNRRARTAKALRTLRSKGRLVLTGTPIENSLDDLRSIFEFLMPGHLSAIPPDLPRDERAWFNDHHRKQAAPYILRRTKTLVAPELPPKIEQTLYCELGPTQRKLYDSVASDAQRALFDLEMKGASEQVMRNAVFVQLLRLRQICAEPRLLDESCDPANSAKLSAFSELLEEAIDDGHRILLFSQFVQVLGHLRTFLEEREYPYCYLDGKTRNRLQVCDRFNESPDIPVFLISLKAGGTGLNLTGADTVIHFDPWWNPAVENQATDRAHRIGQTRLVTSYKLIAADTVEERIMDLQRGKAELLRDLLDESAAANSRISLNELKSLL